MRVAFRRNTTLSGVRKLASSRTATASTHRRARASSTARLFAATARVRRRAGAQHLERHLHQPRAVPAVHTDDPSRDGTFTADGKALSAEGSRACRRGRRRRSPRPGPAETSTRATSARVGVSIPDAFANRRTNASYDSSVSRRAMLRIAAFASSVVASTPTVFPFARPDSANRSSTHVNTATCVSTSIRRRVRDSVEWFGVAR